jgi:hypothetical protein
VVHHDQSISRADEEVNPPDNSLAVVQRCRDGIFSADLAAGPRSGDPCKESLEGSTKCLRIEREGRSLSGKKVGNRPLVLQNVRV